MQSSDELRLKNNSTLKKISLGSKLNWVFIPGGPGLGPEYLSNFLSYQSKLKGSVFTLELPKHCKDFDDHEILINLEEDINQILTELDNVILVGHSFGGMLLQSINLQENSYFKIILLCSPPNLNCFDIAKNSYINFSEQEKESIMLSEKNYSKNKNNTNLQILFKAWAPYYTTYDNFNIYAQMIDKCSFDFEFHEWGNRFFNNFFDSNRRIPKNTIAISSELDKICPSSLFRDYVNQLEDFYILPTSQHFPWIQNFELLMKILQRIE